jgi:hypothetical protein
MRFEATKFGAALVAVFGLLLVSAVGQLDKAFHVNSRTRTVATATNFSLSRLANDARSHFKVFPGSLKRTMKQKRK